MKILILVLIPLQIIAPEKNEGKEEGPIDNLIKSFNKSTTLDNLKKIFNKNDLVSITNFLSEKKNQANNQIYEKLMVLSIEMRKIFVFILKISGLKPIYSEERINEFKGYFKTNFREFNLKLLKINNDIN